MIVVSFLAHWFDIVLHLKKFIKSQRIIFSNAQHFN